MSAETTKPLWTFVPLDEYSVPNAASVTRFRVGLISLWKRIRRDKPGDAAARPESLTLELELLDRIVSGPAWSDAVGALDRALLARQQDGADELTGTHVLIAPPIEGTSDVAAAWGRATGWHVLGPPAVDQVRRGDTGWIDPLLDDRIPGVVVPNVDALYLRHYDGLAVLEQFLERLTRTGRPCLLVCGIYSWLYLTRALQLDSLAGAPLALQALDARGLRSWLLQLAGGYAATVDVRELGSRKRVLSAEDGQCSQGAKNEGDQDETSDFIEHLAAYSRGIPVVARALWRRALRRDPTAGDDEAHTLWVPPWSQLVLPAIPDGPRPDDLLVLQAVLLHRSLPVEVLTEIVPVPAGDVSRSLRRMAGGGLMQNDTGRWSVSDAGYAAARRYLDAAAYPVGAF